MSLKIIGGVFKGRNLAFSTELPTRPLLARAKKSLFDILTPKIAGSVFLDLFAGFGSVGIEAISRGAAKVVFVDNNLKCVKMIEENLDKIKARGIGVVLPCDAGKELPVSDKFDIIFIGPPYAMNELESQVAAMERYVKPDGVIIGQHQFREKMPENIGGLNQYRQEKYGDMRLTFYEKK